MKRIFPEYAYGSGPRQTCWWDDTASIRDIPVLDGDSRCDVAVVGGGFTGLSAALHLAEEGVDVLLLEAEQIGWGASARNGGFCCLGGGWLDDSLLDRRFGKTARLEWRSSEVAAVGLVESLIDRLGVDVDRHSDGETLLAHKPSRWSGLERYAKGIEENYRVTPQLVSSSELERRGFGGSFHGALTNPIGFGLNPRKYLRGLVEGAIAAGARLRSATQVRGITQTGRGHVLKTNNGRIFAENVILATNGYSSETTPDWIGGRYMPAQSSVMVTRPITQTERERQGWTSDQMAYDTRTLLHYFRLMPDGRFMFGMRGGLLSSPRAEAVARQAVRRDFERLFPSWADVETTHAWSGMVCLARNMMPFVGPLPGHRGLFTAMCFHGNGVAMATYAGALLADLILGQDRNLFPAALKVPLERFPLGHWRRLLMPPLYAALRLRDAL